MSTYFEEGLRVEDVVLAGEVGVVRPRPVLEEVCLPLPLRQQVARRRHPQPLHLRHSSAMPCGKCYILLSKIYLLEHGIA